MQERDEGGGGEGGGGLSFTLCSMLASLGCFVGLLRWLFYPGAKGNYPFNLVLTYFNYAQFKAENVIRARALEMRSMKEQGNLNNLSENSWYLTQRHRQIGDVFGRTWANYEVSFVLFGLECDSPKNRLTSSI